MKEKDKKKVPQVTEEEVAAVGAGAADAATGEASGAASAGAAGACECEKAFVSNIVEKRGKRS